MFKFNELKQVHLEITSRCQASCPMCPRNFHGGLENPNLVLNDWTIDHFVSIFNTETLNQIESIFFCGNFGDPIMNNDLIKMCQYIKENKPSMKIRIHTNGGARNNKWWTELYHSLVEDHVVIFAIDGLEDTHHLYRVGTTYENVTKNAKTFIDCGGIGEWVFLRFKHNEHQIVEAERRSKVLKFKRFTIKDTIRFIEDPKYKVFDSTGTELYSIEAPSTSPIKFITKEMVKEFTRTYKETEISCYAQQNREIYIDCHRNLFPCCFLASSPYNHSFETPVTSIRATILNQYHSLVESLGGLDKINCESNSIKDIIDGERYQTVWDRYWNEDKLVACARYCGKNEISKPTDQFTERKNNEFPSN